MMRLHPRTAVLSVGAVIVGACGLFPSLDGLTASDSAVADAANVADAEAGADVVMPSSDAGAEAACPSAHGPAMVQVPGGGFCIDSTEVTNTEYAEFVTAVSMGASIAMPANGTHCAWNGSIAPKTSGDGCTPSTTDTTMHPDWPVTCVTWCDAYAYCAWAGKRICGAVDGELVQECYATVINPTNEWYEACSANGTRTYPYGSSYVKGACNTKDLYDAGFAVANVEAFDACVGGYSNLYDMGGNVEEWFDSCQDLGEGGANDSCHESGDCFNYAATGFARCDNDDSDYRSFAGTDVGIRCCAP